MTAKETLLKEASRWTEHDAEVALRAVEQEHASDQQRSAIDDAIIASYTQIPQEDLGTAKATARVMHDLNEEERAEFGETIGEAWRREHPK
jgi:hypothetical protein